MIGKEFTTPSGMNDTFGNRCQMMRSADQALMKCYRKRGYYEVMTPLLEHYDVFTKAVSALKDQNIRKITDGGNIFVIRPDSTTPIGRLVATKLKEEAMPLRLCYSQDIIRITNGLNPGTAQIRQSGIELIGATGLRAELEIAETALSSLKELGLSGYKLELGHAGIYKSLVNAVDFTDEDEELLRELIDEKNYPAINDLLKPYRVKYTAECETLMQLPRLFGDVRILDTAIEIFENAGAKTALKYLYQLYAALSTLGLDKNIVLDLGLSGNMNYYTGIILSGYASGAGERVLSGGRYDSLYSNYGLEYSATGFAINLDAVCTALENSDKTTPQQKSDVMLFYTEPYVDEAFNLMKNMHRRGLQVEFSMAGDRLASIEIAKRKGIDELHCIDGTGDILSLTIETDKEVNT